jgi:hypothetical protein
MAEIKTKQTNADVHEFINSFADTAQKREDSFGLMRIYKKTGTTRGWNNEAANSCTQMYV